MRRRIASPLALALLLIARPPVAVGGEGLPDSRLGIRTAPLLLLSRGDVRDELKLTPEQVADSERTIADLHEKAAELKGRNDAEAVAARGEIEAASRAWLLRALTPAQRDRLTQLDYQWEGPSAVITRAFVAESLGLSDAQRRALAEAVAERDRRRAGGPPVPADEERLARAVVEQLTEAQQRRWRSVLGPAAPFRAAAGPARATASNR